MWTLWRVILFLLFYWSPPWWTAWKKAGADKVPRGQLGGQWSERWCSHLAALPELMLAPAENEKGFPPLAWHLRGLLVSLQGHEVCVCPLWAGLGVAPNFKSVLNSDLELRSMMWPMQFGDSSVFWLLAHCRLDLWSLILVWFGAK